MNPADHGQQELPTSRPSVPEEQSAARDTAVVRGGRQPTTKVVDVDAAARMYEAGHSLRTIAARVGLSPPRLRLRLLQAGVTMRPAGVRAPVSDDRITTLRDQGLSWGKIAQLVGMDRGGVRNRYYTVTGWPDEPSGKRVTDEQVLQVIGWGATYRQAADMLGLTVGAVAARLYRARHRSHDSGPAPAPRDDA